MNINMDKNLDNDFLTTWNQLKERYGRKFTQLQGLDNSKLNFIHYIRIIGKREKKNTLFIIIYLTKIF